MSKKTRSNDSSTSKEPIVKIFAFIVFGALGTNIAGLFTENRTILQIMFLFSGIVCVTDFQKIWKIDLMLIRRAILIVGMVAAISGTFVYLTSEREVGDTYIQYGLQTFPTWIMSAGALIYTLYYHYVDGNETLKTRIYVLKDTEYKRIVGPSKLLKSINRYGGFIVIGDKFRVHGNLSISDKSKISHDSINEFDLEEMILAPLDEKDKSILELS